MHAPAAISKSKRLRWTVDEYFRMSGLGLLDGRRVELIDGEIIEAAAQGDPHRLCISKTIRLLMQAFPPSTHWVVVQGTLRLNRFSAPDPDLQVLDVPETLPTKPLPLPFVLIEVSDTPYRDDAGVKLRMYARAGIDDYWIVNISQRRVEVYRRPDNPTGRRSGWRYADIHFHTPGETVTMLARPDIALAVSAMLP